MGLMRFLSSLGWVEMLQTQGDKIEIFNFGRNYFHTPG